MGNMDVDATIDAMTVCFYDKPCSVHLVEVSLPALAGANYFALDLEKWIFVEMTWPKNTIMTSDQ